MGRRIKTFCYVSMLLLSIIFPPHSGVAFDGSARPKILFWEKVKKGANVFNEKIFQEDIRAAKVYGIGFIRLALDKFPSAGQDFLMGNADCYEHLNGDDLALLKKILDVCAEEDMPVIITMLGLPGSRWKQLNGDEDDLRIWQDADFQQQAARFWKNLAQELRDYEIVVGYNILNEPHPERLFDQKNCHISSVEQKKIQKMLFDFYNLVIGEIRKVDANTPIIVDSSAYGDPNAFKQLRKLDDNNVIYSFHMYEPYEYTNHKLNAGTYVYPGDMDGQNWDYEALHKYMEPVIEFQRAHAIPSNRILVGEFGCYRKQKGLPEYFSDLISIFDECGWHYAFYAFREDNWDGMDYELGDQNVPEAYWQAIENGETPNGNRESTTAQFAILLRALFDQNK